jgi:hypothetical protein
VYNRFGLFIPLPMEQPRWSKKLTVLSAAQAAKSEVLNLGHQARSVTQVVDVVRRHDFVTLAHKRNSLMSTSDETYVALRHFQKLRSSAPTIWSEMTRPDLGQVRSRLVSWLREARETARVLLGADCYVVAELDKLIPGNDGPLDFEDLKGLKEKALALLDSAERSHSSAVRQFNIGRFAPDDRYVRQRGLHFELAS